MDQTRTDTHYCESCGTALTPADPAPLCMRCDTQRADSKLDRDRADNAAAGANTQAARAKRRALIRRVVTVALLMVSVAVILIQAPALLGAVSPAKPLREGTAKTDAAGDACIANLWLGLSDATEGRPVRAMTCPASGAPYLVTTVGGATVVACPNPDRHGLAEMSASTAGRVPVVR